MVVDDEGRPVALRGPVRRVVSIVPSLTEAVAATDRNLLVGATDWCTHPADLDVVRVRGTKNPDVERIVALRPDLVLANAEENRLPDLDALRAAGVAVYVTDIRTLDGAFAGLRHRSPGRLRLGEPADAREPAGGEHPPQRGERAVEGADIGDVDGEAGRAQGVEVGQAVLLGVREHEVGPQRDDLPDVRVLRAANPRDVQVARVRAPVRRPDQQGSGGGGDRLGERGDDADDAPHRSAQRDRKALVVDDHPRDATAPGRRATRRTP